MKRKLFVRFSFDDVGIALVGQKLTPEQAGMAGLVPISFPIFDSSEFFIIANMALDAIAARSRYAFVEENGGIALYAQPGADGNVK